MNEVLGNLLHIQAFSIWEIYSYVSKNLGFYQQDDVALTTLPSSNTIVEPESSVSSWHEGTTNSILLLSLMQQYMGIVPNDVAEKNGKVLVDFTFGKINFIANFNIKIRSLSPIYFKDISINDQPYMIQGFGFVLSDSGKTNISDFLINPLNYIKKKDSTARQNYMQK